MRTIRDTLTLRAWMRLIAVVGGIAMTVVAVGYLLLDWWCAINLEGCSQAVQSKAQMPPEKVADRDPKACKSCPSAGLGFRRE